MLENLLSILKTLGSMLFPERLDERLVKHFNAETIYSLPKSNEEPKGVNSIFSYKDKKVQALIWEIKYHKNPTAISIVGKILAENIQEDVSDRALFENWKEILLVGVPLTNKRLRERTFSQTDLICREIIKNLSPEMQKIITYSPNALRKIRETEKQSHTKSRAERLRNLQNCFKANPEIVKGKNIILIDDVTTTGATIHEAVKSLKLEGAKNVLSFTIAH
jgi:ComF family protein